MHNAHSAFSAPARRWDLPWGGEAGQRTANKLCLPVSADTLFRLLRSTPLEIRSSTFQVIGIDDWAFKRRESYGTLIVDLEQHQPTALLSDRTAESVAAWLKHHPEIRIVTRDRSTEFARGIHVGAPQAKQVADRWHLLKNLTEVLERLLCSMQLNPRSYLVIRSEPIVLADVRLRHH